MPHLSEGGSRYTGSYRQRPHSSLGDYSSYANDYARDYNGYHDGYDSLSDVGEIRVYQRADFQSGSRVLKKVF